LVLMATGRNHREQGSFRLWSADAGWPPPAHRRARRGTGFAAEADRYADVADWGADVRRSPPMAAPWH
jgi:hypothetical protein